MEQINLMTLIGMEKSDLPKEFDKLNAIYKITNIINGSAYVGQAKSIKTRLFTLSGYKDSINKWILSGFNGNLTGKLFPAFREYGVENFVFEILQFDIDLIDLDSIEIKWISELNTYSDTGYNCTKGGQFKPIGFKWSQGAKLKYSERMKLKYATDSEYAEKLKLSLSKGRDSIKLKTTKISYESLIKSCIKFKSLSCIFHDGLIFKDKTEYNAVKFKGSPTYTKSEMKRNFANYREFGFDLSLISECIRPDWQ